MSPSPTPASKPDATPAARVGRVDVVLQRVGYDAMNRTIVLASRSPRRVELLTAAGVVFQIDPADIDEDDLPSGLAPADVARHLAEMKATTVARRHPDAVVLGSDTVVAIGDRLFGKADTPDQARQMLLDQMGHEQFVHTGVAVVCLAERRNRTELASARLRMERWTPAELDAYIASDDWRGKAGAYGIQDRDVRVRLLEGDFHTVVGLPIDRVLAMLAPWIGSRNASA
jgi:septum formation protein